MHIAMTSTEIAVPHYHPATVPGPQPDGRTAATSPEPGDPTAHLDPRLILVKRRPLNAEAPLHELCGLITPTPLFYIRSNFNIPRLAAADWRLSIGGAVQQTVTMTYDELRSLPSRSLLVTLECAGNGRADLRPMADGEPWEYGAVSTAEWTGVSLGTLLAAAGLTAQAREILVQGADRGTVATRSGTIPFARSLCLEKALHEDTLLAYAMNGEPLSAEHGFPARLIVPGWYGMAAVKWVERIEAITESFDGYYQTERYIMTHPERPDNEVVPLTSMHVRSLITAPAIGATVPRGVHTVRGFAWSGQTPVTRVEVSVDGGVTWEAAAFASAPERYAWRRWEYRWQAETPGPVELRSRAFDELGHGQPTEPEWNKLGYANSSIQEIPVTVTPYAVSEWYV